MARRNSLRSGFPALFNLGLKYLQIKYFQDWRGLCTLFTQIGGPPLRDLSELAGGPANATPSPTAKVMCPAGAEPDSQRRITTTSQSVFTRIICSAALLPLLVVGSAQATPFLVGVSSQAISGAASNLFNINPLTGAATAIGPIGFQFVGGIDWNGTTLFGISRPGGQNNPTQLITINPLLGTGALVGPTGPNNDVRFDISFRNADDVLRIVNLRIVNFKPHARACAAIIHVRMICTASVGGVQVSRRGRRGCRRGLERQIELCGGEKTNGWRGVPGSRHKV